MSCLNNKFGSIHQTWDNGGKFLNNQDYDPDGVPYQTNALSLGYSGELTDPNGLVYLRARVYAPMLGTFLTRDPVEGVMARVASRNGYGYVEGNPVNYTDPSGECFWRTDVTHEQGMECATSWENYLYAIANQFGPATSWSPEVSNAVACHRNYWGNLPYTEFVKQWNDSTFAPCAQASGTAFVLAPAFTIPLLTEPSQVGKIALGILVCVGLVIGIAAASQAVTMPVRPASSQSKVNEKENITRVPVPLKGCPPCPQPNPKCHVNRVPPSRPHPPCIGDHFHEIFINQNPVTCQCFEVRQSYLTPFNCISPQGAPPPNPPCDTWY